MAPLSDRAATKTLESASRLRCGCGDKLFFRFVPGQHSEISALIVLILSGAPGPDPLKTCHDRAVDG